jgi:hypothetical protein
MSSNTLSTTPFFTPTSVSGCALWLDGADASTLVLSGSNVTQWNDKSGNGYNTSNLTGTPTYSSNGINFTGTQAMGTNLGYAASLSNHSMFAVISYTSGFNGAFIETNNTLGNNGCGIDFFVTGGQQRVNGWSTGLIVNGATGLSLNTLNLHEFTFATGSSGSAYIYLDGRQTGSNISINFTFTAGGFFSLGNWKNGASYGTFFTGQINETVVYSNVLSTAQRQQVEGYLAWKWGLQSNLPSSHPYRYAPQGVYQIPPNIRPTGPITLAPSPSPFVFFNPTRIAGCQLWLDGTDPNGNSTLLSDGASIASWKDKSGNGYDLAQATAGNRPTFSLVNSMGMINFTRANKTYLINTVLRPLMTNFTLFMIVQRKTVPSDNERWFVAIPVAYATDWNTTTGLSFNTVLEIASNGSGAVFSDSSDLNLNVYTINTATNTANLYKNGGTNALITKSLGITGNSIGVLLGSGTNGGINSVSEQFNGYMGEVLFFPRSLTLGQQQQVEGYLAWKWGLVGKLPTTHPFKNAPPGLPIATVPLTRQLGGGVFSPLSVSGCSVWLDAADGSTISLSGTAVTQWRDKSGNGKNATTNSSVGPNYTQTVLNASPSLYFDGTNFMSFANNTLIGPNGTFFVVAKEDAGQSGQCFLMQNYLAFGVAEFQFDTTGVNLFYPPWQPTGSWASRISSWSLLGAEIIKITGRLNTYTNGSLSTSASISVSSTTGDTADGTNIGRYTVNGTESLVLRYKGFIAEIIYYNNVIPTTFQRQQVEGYLAWKWGLVGNLPATHPYKKWPPPP